VIVSKYSTANALKKISVKR